MPNQALPAGFCSKEPLREGPVSGIQRPVGGLSVPHRILLIEYQRPAGAITGSRQESVDRHTHG